MRRIILLIAILFLLPTPLHAQADTTTPVVMNLKFSPKIVDVSTGAKIITATMRIVDATGLQDAGIFIYPLDAERYPDQYIIFGVTRSNLVGGTLQDGMYKVDFVVAAGSAEGPWLVEGIDARDTLGNERFYTPTCREASLCIHFSNEKGFLVMDNYFLPYLRNGIAKDCVDDLYDCADFPTWNDAQLAYQFCMVQGLGDPYGLDRDADNFACEHLPNPWL